MEECGVVSIERASERSREAETVALIDGQSTYPEHHASVCKRLGPYDILGTIGKGNFSVVKLAIHRQLKIKVAIKIMNKDLIGEVQMVKVRREIAAIKALRHPHIVKIYQVMESGPRIYMVMEYACAGEIFEQINMRKVFPEVEAREVFWQVVCAVDYCHRSGIVHRDLKAENLLLDSRHNIKVADFGFCNFLVGASPLGTHCGSPQYAAPELFKGELYDGPKADIWSMGVVLYIMVCGCFPFPGESLSTIRNRVLSCPVNFPFYLSLGCKGIIDQMLQKNPEKRASIHDIMSSPWMLASSRSQYFLNLASWPSANSHENGDLSASTDVLVTLEKLGYSRKQVISALDSRSFDQFYAAYHLLHDKLLQHCDIIDSKDVARDFPFTNDDEAISSFESQVETTLSRNDLSPNQYSSSLPSPTYLIGRFPVPGFAERICSEGHQIDEEGIPGRCVDSSQNSEQEFSMEQDANSRSELEQLEAPTGTQDLNAAAMYALEQDLPMERRHTLFGENATGGGVAGVQGLGPVLGPEAALNFDFANPRRSSEGGSALLHLHSQMYRMKTRRIYEAPALGYTLDTNLVQPCQLPSEAGMSGRIGLAPGRHRWPNTASSTPSSSPLHVRKAMTSLTPPRDPYLPDHHDSEPHQPEEETSPLVGRTESRGRRRVVSGASAVSPWLLHGQGYGNVMHGDDDLQPMATHAHGLFSSQSNKTQGLSFARRYQKRYSLPAAVLASHLQQFRPMVMDNPNEEKAEDDSPVKSECYSPVPSEFYAAPSGNVRSSSSLPREGAQHLDVTRLQDELQRLSCRHKVNNNCEEEPLDLLGFYQTHDVNAGDQLGPPVNQQSFTSTSTFSSDLGYASLASPTTPHEPWNPTAAAFHWARRYRRPDETLALGHGYTTLHHGLRHGGAVSSKNASAAIHPHPYFGLRARGGRRSSTPAVGSHEYPEQCSQYGLAQQTLHPSSDWLSHNPTFDWSASSANPVSHSSPQQPRFWLDDKEAWEDLKAIQKVNEKMRCQQQQVATVTTIATPVAYPQISITDAYGQLMTLESKAPQKGMLFSTTEEHSHSE